MTRRNFAGKPSRPDGVSAHLQPLVDDDEFLTALSHGEDPTRGADDLAALLLELRADVNAQMPPAPTIAGAEDGAEDGDAHGGGSTVVDLDAERSRRRSLSPWLSGLIGAAAATVVVAGTGSALYNATPGSPLWGPATAVFGDRAAVVELAGTLEELEAASASGDDNATRGLLEQAQMLLGIIAGNDGQDKGATPSTTVTERTTAQPPTPSGDPAPPAAPVPASPAPATVTQTETVTVTVTPAPAPSSENPAPAPSRPSETTPTSPTTTVQPSLLQPASPIAPAAGVAAE